MANKNAMGLHNIFANFLEEIKNGSDMLMQDIYASIGSYMGVQGEAVRKYKSGIPSRHREELMNAVIELAFLKEIDIEKISWFHRHYENEAGISLQVRMSKDSSVRRFSLAERYSEEILCPCRLSENLHRFVKESSKKFLYLCGTMQCGALESVARFMGELNAESMGLCSYGFEIDMASVEEIKQCAALRLALYELDYVVIDTGLSAFPDELLGWNNRARVIIVANIPHRVKYLENMEYLVFDDLANDRANVEQLVKDSKAGMYHMLLQTEDRLGDLFILELQAQTGGLPAAVRRLNRELFEKAVFRFATNLEEQLKVRYCKLAEMKETYEELWRECLEKKWERISESARTALLRINCFEGNISLELLHYLSENEMSDVQWKAVLQECYDNMLLMESGKTREEENGSIQGIRMFPLEKELLRFRHEDEQMMRQTKNRALEFYFMKAREFTTARFYRGQKTYFDRAGEFELIREVLQYCEEEGRDQEYLELTRELQDFFALRERYAEKVKEIYCTRLRIAKRSGNRKEVLETYGCLMNINAKRACKSTSLEWYAEAKDFCKKNAKTEILGCHKYMHGMALVEFLTNGKAEEALKIWNAMLEADDLTESERISCERWSLRCRVRLNIESLDRLRDEALSGYDEADEKRYWKTALDYSLLLSRIDFLLYLKKEDSADNLEEFSQYLFVAEELLRKNPYIESDFRTDYYMLKCFEAAIKRENCEEFLELSIKYYFKANRKKRRESMNFVVTIIGKKEVENGKLTPKDEKKVIDFVI